MMYHIILENGQIMMDLVKTKITSVCLFLSESISSVNMYLHVYYKDPNEKSNF